MFDINNLQVKSNIKAIQLEEAINKIKQDNKLKGLGTAFIDAENKYNVNAIILASIACLESGYGTSKLAIEKNNLFGLDAPLSATGTDNYGSGYKNKEECIDYAGHRIGKQYLELDSKASWRYCEGKKDIYAVGAKWCEVKGWSDKVISIANRIEKNINGGNFMKILISAGHTLTGKGTGAVGFINESQENRVLAKFVVEYLKKLGHEVDYHEVNSGSDFMILNYCYKQDENGYTIYPASDYSKLVEEDYKIKIDETQKKVSILEAENEALKQELSITQDAVNELIFNSLNM